MAGTDDERIRHAIEETEVLRPPRHILATFGITSIHYYLLTTPVYADVQPESRDTVVREGTVSAHRPQVVTPTYMANLEGFSEEARRYFQMETRGQGAHAPGILYAYRNDPGEMNIVSDELKSVGHRIVEDLDNRAEPLAAVVKGLDELWDVSLLKFVYELTTRSVVSNLREMYSHRLLDTDARGVPRQARQRIEEMFSEVERGNLDPNALKRELDGWDVFDEYEARFLSLFRRR